MRTVAWAIALGAGLATALAGCGSQGGRTAAAPVRAGQGTVTAGHVATIQVRAAAHTTVHEFRAFTASGAPAVRIARTTSGSCWTGSIATPVVHAYRCMSGNAILDPCFVPSGTAHPASALCLSGPTAAAVRLTLTGALPAGPPLTTAHRPWAFRLSNGAQCEISTGTVAVVGGRSYPYFCGTAGYSTQPTAGHSSPGTDSAWFVAADAVRATAVTVTDVWTV